MFNIQIGGKLTGQCMILCNFQENVVLKLKKMYNNI